MYDLAIFESLEPRLLLSGESPNFFADAIPLSDFGEAEQAYFETANTSGLTQDSEEYESTMWPSSQMGSGGPADLYVHSFSCERYSAGPGQAIGDVLRLTIGNKGMAAVTQPFTAGIYFSTDAQIDKSDTQLGTSITIYNLLQGQTVQIPLTGINVPVGAIDGNTCYIGVLVDEGNVVTGELSESNNSASAPLLITKAEWTVMVYANGDNDLEWQTIKKLDQMEQVKLPQDKVKLLIQLDRHPGTDLDKGYAGWNLPTSNSTSGNWSDTRRGEVIYDGKWNPVLGMGTYATKLSVANPLQPELDMGDDDTLIDFVRWGMKMAPARHYALIMTDHGGGWQGMSEDYTDAVGAHDSAVSSMDMIELRNALDKVSHLDVLAMDMCMMQQVEVATEMIGEVDFFVAAPNSEGGFQYEPWLKWLGANPAGSAENLARQMVAASDWAAAALDMAKLPALIQALNTFAIEVPFTAGIGHPTVTDWSIIHGARQAAKYYKCWDEYRDLRAFSGYIAGSIHSISYHIRTAAQNVFDAANDVVLCNKGQGQGLTIYLPEPGMVDAGYDYFKDLTFSDPKQTHGTRWAEFLRNMPDSTPPPSRILTPVILETDPGDLIGPRPPVFPPSTLIGQELYEDSFRIDTAFTEGLDLYDTIFFDSPDEAFAPLETGSVSDEIDDLFGWDSVDSGRGLLCNNWTEFQDDISENSFGWWP